MNQAAYFAAIRQMTDEELLSELSEERVFQLQQLLYEGVVAVAAFRDPEGAFPEDTGEFRQLGEFQRKAEKALNLVPTERLLKDRR